MSNELYNELSEEIDFYSKDEEDKFIEMIDILLEQGKITYYEYGLLIEQIEEEKIDNEIPDCIWEAMCECNPDLRD